MVDDTNAFLSSLCNVASSIPQMRRLDPLSNKRSAVCTSISEDLTFSSPTALRFCTSLLHGSACLRFYTRSLKRSLVSVQRDGCQWSFKNRTCSFLRGQGRPCFVGREASFRATDLVPRIERRSREELRREVATLGHRAEHPVNRRAEEAWAGVPGTGRMQIGGTIT